MRSIIYILPGLIGLFSCTASHDTTDGEGPSPPKTPAEQLASFALEPGLSIALVASEPMVQDPVVITFDADGRLWVVEMRGFMPNIDGEGEDQPVGRVSVLEDRDGDGRMDASTIYLDSLILPRAIALVSGGALIAENRKLWMTRDLDNDLRADTKSLIDSSYAATGNPEHSANGLWRGVDNWYYNAKSHLRYKIIDGELLSDSTEIRGQWGISHDDEGRLYYNYNWSQLHADLVPPDYLSANRNHSPTTGIDHGLTLDRRIYPIRSNPAVNRGYMPGTLDEKGRLLEFTAACSPFYYRGHSLPAAYYGNVFVCEPSGNLVKRNVLAENGLSLRARDLHPGKEFLASTDERFRPVHLATGPDGALYVADMYRGLVQHGAYVTPYLREQTLKRKLDQPVHYGRIWRITRDNHRPSSPERLSERSPEALVSLLSHPDGWHRDIAQRLLVERGDQRVAPALRAIAANGSSPLGRIHALWVLEGIQSLNGDYLLTCLNDEHPAVRITALRLLEPFAEKDEVIRRKLGQVMMQRRERAPVKEILQMALTARALSRETSHQLLLSILDRCDTSALIRDAVLSSLADQEYVFLKKFRDLRKHPSPASEIFIEMLVNAVVKKRDFTELDALLSMINANPAGWQEKVMLAALCLQASHDRGAPVPLAKAPPLLIREDIEIAISCREALALMFEWPGHEVNPDKTARRNLLDEKDQEQFLSGRRHYLTSCAGCHGTDGAGLHRFAPTLIGSEWVLGDPKRLALIVLHGLEGAIVVNGRRYDEPDILPVMPSHSTMDDAAISAVLTYIRNEWGNNAGPVPGRIVGSTRHTSQGRVSPWTAGELNEYVKTKVEQ